MHDDSAERWLPLADAARELGISTDTARRRLRKGQLHGEQRPTPQGFTWWLRIGDSATSAGSPTQHAQAPAAGVVELVHLVARLQTDLVTKAEAAAMWQARAELLASQVEQLQRALPPPSAPEIAPGRDSDAVPSGPTQTPAEPQPRVPWWAPWRRLAS